MKKATKRQFDKTKLPILADFENSLLAFHNEANEADIIPNGFRNEWASAMDRLQMILMAARTLCREKREEFDFHDKQDSNQ